MDERVERAVVPFGPDEFVVEVEVATVGDGLGATGVEMKRVDVGAEHGRESLSVRGSVSKVGEAIMRAQKRDVRLTFVQLGHGVVGKEARAGVGTRSGVVALSAPVIERCEN